MGGCETTDTEPPEIGVVRASLLSAASCPAGTNIIQGNNSANTLTGTAGNDCILGHGGNDTIHGLGGNDFLIGGTGIDTLNGNDGSDVLHGEDGVDTLNGHAGNDTLYGGGSGDNLFGGDDDDTAYGDIGNDTIEGGFGNDTLYGSSGGDILRGGEGSDRIFGEADADDLYGDGGDDILDGGAAGDDIWGGTGHDVIQGGANNDNLRGDDGNDAILGGTGVNTVNGGNGTDRCSGTSCELAAPTATGCTQNSQCASPQSCVIDLGVCLPCLSDVDGDNVCDASDGCPSDPLKGAPGVCGCGVTDADSDSDGTPNCNDACSTDPNKVAPGICGCGVSDADSDSDGTPDCNDACSADPDKVAAGICGCGVSDADSDSDGVADCDDVCAGFDDALDADDDGVPDGCDIGCVPGATGPFIYDGDVLIDDAAEIASLEGIRCITGELAIRGGALTDLTGLEAIEEVGVVISIANTTALTSLDGLEGLLPTQTAALYVYQNTALTDLSALSELTDLGGTLYIEDNDALQGLSGLLGLEQIGTSDPNAALVVAYNDQLPSCWKWILEAQLGVECGAVSGTPTYDCSGNAGAGTCGALPPGFVCEPGATGPGVYDGDLFIAAGFGVDPAELAGLTCVTGSLQIGNVGSLDLSALATLEQVGGLGIMYSDITDLSFLSGLRAIRQYLTVYATWQLVDLDGLENLETVASNIGFGENTALANVHAIGGAELIAGEAVQIFVSNNDALTSLAGLANMAFTPSPETMLTELNISDNGSLAPCWIWSLEGKLDVSCNAWGWPCSGNGSAGSCGELPPGFACVPGASGPGVYDGSLNVGAYAQPTLEELAGLNCVTGELWILYTDLTDLSALSTLDAIGSGLTIYGNGSLASLTGLEELDSVGDSVSIVDNDALDDLAALASLDTIIEVTQPPRLHIADNASLPACWVETLEAAVDLECGDFQQSCDGNTGSGTCPPPVVDCVPGASGPGIFDGDVVASGLGAGAVLDALAGVHCITGSLTIEGSDLSELAQLASLVELGGALHVNDNPALPACRVAELELQVGSECLRITTEGAEPCSGNDGSGSCFDAEDCVYGASGPGIFDGGFYINPGWPDNDPGDLAGVHCITGDLLIFSSPITDLSALAALRYIGGQLTVYNNDELVSLSGLHNVESVGTELWIAENDVLQSLDGLASVQQAAELGISNNPALPACWVSELEAQMSLSCGGFYTCTGNTGTGSCD